MRKCFLSLMGIVAVMAASAQFSVGVAGNYTMYKQDFQKSTPGAQIRVGYDVNYRLTGVLSFNYGMPINYESYVTLRDNGGNQTTADSEIKYKFKTFSLLGHYSFLGDNETTGKFYGIFGIGYVMVNFNEEITEDYDKTVYQAMDIIEGKENGLTLNFGAGGEYNFGGLAVFGEGSLALPANKVNNAYIENAIPSHFILNLGVRVPLGGGDYY